MAKAAVRIILTLIGCLAINHLMASTITMLSNKTTPRVSMPMDGWRLGIGAGFAIYLGDQMDYTITRGYGDFKELRPNLTLSAYKQINQSTEWGLVFKKGSMQTLKSENTQGLQCDFLELQSNWQKSLNDNLSLSGRGITVNVQYGFGFMNYKSMYFSVNPNFVSIDGVLVNSSVGYGYEEGERTDIMGNEYTDIPNRKFCLVTNLGLNLGFNITRNLKLYWENSVQISTSNKLSGNLNKVAKIPPDGYFYTGVSLFYRFGMAGGRLGCPRF